MVGISSMDGCQEFKPEKYEAADIIPRSIP
jgi:hypothetical protein